MPRLRIAVCAILAAVTLAGCEVEVAQDADVAPTEDGARSGLIRLYGGTDAESACFADGLLAELTLDDLVAAEIIEDDGEVAAALPRLRPDVAAVWVDVATTCTPPNACLSATLSPDQLRAGRIDVLTGDLIGDAARAVLLRERACR